MNLDLGRQTKSTKHMLQAEESGWNSNPAIPSEAARQRQPGTVPS